MVRTTIVLAVLAALLLAFIVFYERDTLSTGEVERRKGDVVPELVRDRLSRIEIQRKGEVTTLERAPDPEADGDFGDWKVVAPYAAAADRDAVEDLLGELEWMAQKRRLDGVSEADRKRFGFDAPRFRIWFTVGRERHLILVANETPQKDGVYVQGTAPGAAFVVAKELVETLDREPMHYHTKELHEGLSALTALSVRLRDDGGERVLAKRDDRWHIERPIEADASESAVDALVDSLDRLRAKRVVSLEAGDPKRYGLDTPFFEADVTLKRFVPPTPAAGTGAGEAPKPASTETVVRLRVGATCADHAGERYAQVDGGPVTCVAEADLAGARTGVQALRATDGGAAAAGDDLVPSASDAGPGELVPLAPEDGPAE